MNETFPCRGCGASVTPRTFSRIADKTRLGPAGREMARRVLVDGLRPAEVARRMGVVPQTVRDKLHVIANALRAEQGAPAGWVVVTVLVPPDVASEIREIARLGGSAD